MYLFFSRHQLSDYIGLTYLATRRGNPDEDAGFFKHNTIYNKDVLDGLETLYQQYLLSEDPNKLARIRIEHVHAFQAFAVLCLRHTVGVMTWKVKHRKCLITDVFSLSDEALALVILENNAKVWRNKAYSIADTDTNARYMTKAKDGSVRKVWSNEGKKRFNDVFAQVRELRSFSLSKTNEKELMRLWNHSSRNRPVREQSTDNDGGANTEREIIMICEG